MLTIIYSRLRWESDQRSVLSPNSGSIRSGVTPSSAPPLPITTSEDLKKGEQKFKLEKKKKNSKRNKKTMQNTSWMVGTNDESATGSLRRYTPKKKNRYYFQSPEFISLLLDT